jgi:DNA-binding MarR family transcriptional regulator
LAIRFVVDNIVDVSTIPASLYWVTDVRWLDEGEERAWRSFQVMQVRLAAELARDLSAHSELSYEDYLVLVALTDRPDGRMRLFELGKRLGWEKSRISHQVTRMAERGLLAKCGCDADRRGAVVAVNAHGRSRIEGAAPSHLRAVRRLFVDRLTPDQLASLREVAETVLNGIDEAAPDGLPGRLWGRFR